MASEPDIGAANVELNGKTSPSMEHGSLEIFARVTYVLESPGRTEEVLALAVSIPIEMHSLG